MFPKGIFNPPFTLFSVGIPRTARTYAKERKRGSSVNSMRRSKLTELSGDARKTSSVLRLRWDSSQTNHVRQTQKIHSRKSKANVDTTRRAKLWLPTRSLTIQRAGTRSSILSFVTNVSRMRFTQLMCCSTRENGEREELV